jgi:hypothetical protein
MLGKSIMLACPFLFPNEQKSLALTDDDNNGWSQRKACADNN